MAEEDDLDAQLAAFEAEVADIDVEVDEKTTAAEATTQSAQPGPLKDDNVVFASSSSSSSCSTPHVAAKSTDESGTEDKPGNHQKTVNVASSISPSVILTEEVAVTAQPTLNPEYLAALQRHQEGGYKRRKVGVYSAEDPVDEDDTQGSSKSASVGGSNEVDTSTTGATESAATSQSHLRVGATGVFEDKTLDEWPENDFRLWVGQLGNEVDDKLLTSKFSDYRSFNMARVIRNRKTGKSKNYGIVSFQDPMEMVRAMREQQKKYCGTRRMEIRRSRAEDRDLSTVRKNDKKRKKAFKRLGVM